MIPWFPQPTLDLGPVSIHAFGALVALAVLVGSRLFERRAAREGLDAGFARRLTSWLLLGGFAGAHLFERLFYDLPETLADPLSLLRFWEGLSSFGGFVGALIGVGLLLRREPRPEGAWPWLDALAVVFPVAWILGRLGCFVAFDHPGLPTDLPFGQTYADGVVRHNLGLYEAVFAAGISVVMARLGRVPRRPGELVGWLAVLYAPGRFALDVLRVAEDRLLGLVVSQYGSIVLFLVGLGLLWWSRRETDERPAASAPAEPVAR